jgi:hypothetical protein
MRNVSGITTRQGEQFPGAEPGTQFYPVSAIDYLTGYLMAFGGMVALARRAREGGSWLVRISLGRGDAGLPRHIGDARDADLETLKGPGTRGRRVQPGLSAGDPRQSRAVARFAGRKQEAGSSTSCACHRQAEELRRCQAGDHNHNPRYRRASLSPSRFP